LSQHEFDLADIEHLSPCDPMRLRVCTRLIRINLYEEEQLLRDAPVSTHRRYAYVQEHITAGTLDQFCTCLNQVCDYVEHAANRCDQRAWTLLRRAAGNSAMARTLTAYEQVCVSTC
jgi:hypothetical protein